MTNALTKEKQRLFELMPVELQEVALSVNRKLQVALKGQLKIMHQLGVGLREVKENPAKYGDGAFKQLASYHNCKVDHLYKLIRLADTYSEEQLVEISRRALKMSSNFSLSHIHELCLIESDSTRQKYLDECIDKSYTVIELRAVIAKVKKPRKPGSGRKPAKILSIPTGAQQLAKQTASFAKFLQARMQEGDFCDQMKDLPPAEFTETLAQDLRQSLASLKRIQEKYEVTRQQLVEVLERHKSSHEELPSVKPR